MQDVYHQSYDYCCYYYLCYLDARQEAISHALDLCKTWWHRAQNPTTSNEILDFKAEPSNTIANGGMRRNTTCSISRRAMEKPTIQHPAVLIVLPLIFTPPAKCDDVASV